VRYAKGCCPAELWVDYFTSSAVIHRLLEIYGQHAFEVEVRRTFTTAQQACAWEAKVITRAKLVTDARFLNKHNAAFRPVNRGLKAIRLIANPKHSVRIPIDAAIPNGFELGCYRTPPKKSNKGTFWCHDPATLAYAMLAEVPVGWVKGRPSTHNTNSAKISGRSFFLNPEGKRVHMSIKEAGALGYPKCLPVKKSPSRGKQKLRDLETGKVVFIDPSERASFLANPRYVDYFRVRR